MTEAKELITNKTVICLISETKLDQSFPNQQFQVHGYKMFQRDRDTCVGGVLFYLDEPSKPLQVNSTLDENEVILLEFSTEGLKWLCTGIYKAPSQNEKYFIDNLSKNLGELTCQYDKTMFIGDFNLTTDKKNPEIFMNAFNLESLMDTNQPVSNLKICHAQT